MALSINKGKKARPQRVVIYGTEGIGKTTLAAEFPDPLFIDIEDGSASMDVARINPPHGTWTWDDIISTVLEISKTPDVCKTIVIDTADRAELLCTDALLKNAGLGGIEDFGYGKGYTYLVEKYKNLLDALDRCISSGVNTVLVGHAQLRKIEQPEQIGAYDHWEMKLSKKVAPLVKEWSDILLFCNYKTLVVEEKNTNTKKAKGGKRVMYTTHTPFWDAKNRCGFPDQVEMNFDSIKSAFDTSHSESANVKSEVDSQPTPKKRTRDEVVEENEKKEKDYMDSVQEKLDEVADGREEVPFDEVADAVDEVKKPEMEKPPRRTRKARTEEEPETKQATLARDTYFKTADGNYIMKHAGDEFPKDAKIISKEEYIEGSTAIAQADNPTPARRRRRRA